MGHHALDHRLATDEVAAKKDHREQPVDQGRFPHDEDGVVEGQGHATKDRQQSQGRQVHLFDPVVAPPDPANLDRGGGDRHHRGDIDARQLVGDEEEQDGQKVDQ